jgi:type II secretory pathway component GspD/PulD (secretin)
VKRLAISLFCVGLLFTGAVEPLSAQEEVDDNPFDPRPRAPLDPLEPLTSEANTDPFVRVAPAEPTQVLSREEILQRLARPIEAEFIEVPLRDVIDYVAVYLELPFVIDQAALDDEGLTGDESVSLDLEVAKAEAALNESLRPFGLDFVVMDGYVLVSTRVELEETRHVRVYDCSKIFSRVASGSGENGTGRGGTFGESPIVQMIKHAAAPGTWYVPVTGGDPSHGPSETDGTISQLGGLLIVRHNPLVHRQIEQLLADLDEKLPSVPAPDTAAAAPVSAPEGFEPPAIPRPASLPE